jgi:hypothetical protein
MARPSTQQPGFLAQLFFLAAGYLVYTLWRVMRESSGHTPFHLVLFVALVAVGLGAIGVAIAGSKHRREQVERGEFAGRVHEAFEAGELPPPYTLFLSPFYVRKKMEAKNPRKGAVPLLPAYFSEPARLPFESVLAGAFENDHPLVALDAEGDVVGVGSIATDDEDWMEVFRKLSGAAEVVVVIPSERPGTRWELEWLQRRDGLRKTIFVMPPKTETRAIDLAKEWERSREDLRDLFELPDYKESGALFVLDDRGRVMADEAIDLNSATRMRQSVDRLLAALADAPASAVEGEAQSPGDPQSPGHQVQKVPCTRCGARILPATAAKHHGRCAPCARRASKKGWFGGR